MSFLCNRIMGFDKNASSIHTIVVSYTHFHMKLVWRLSEFAFFVRLLRWSHFLFYGGMENEEDYEWKNRFPHSNKSMLLSLSQ